MCSHGVNQRSTRCSRPGGGSYGSGQKSVTRVIRHLERTLYTASADGQPGSLVQSCNVMSLGPGGQHPLVDCFSKLGALVDGQIVSQPAGVP